MNMPRSTGPFRALAISLVLLSGCGSTDPLYPVSGKVTLDGVPLSFGRVVFVPDSAKGNKLQASPAGKIGPDGVYTLSTGGKAGAPAGWYKVTVVTQSPGAPTDAPRIPAHYGDFTKTDLGAEVTATPTPGTYDQKLRRGAAGNPR